MTNGKLIYIIPPPSLRSSSPLFQGDKETENGKRNRPLLTTHYSLPTAHYSLLTNSTPYELHSTHCPPYRVQHIHDPCMVRTPEVAGYAHPARQHTSVCHHTHIVGSGTDGILLHDSGQPLWFPWQRRSILPVPTEDYTGGHNPRGLHHLHRNMLPRRIPALEPPRRLRVYDNGGVFRVLKITRHNDTDDGNLMHLRLPSSFYALTSKRAKIKGTPILSNAL